MDNNNVQGSIEFEPKINKPTFGSMDFGVDPNQTSTAIPSLTQKMEDFKSKNEKVESKNEYDKLPVKSSQKYTPRKSLNENVP